MNSTPFTTLDPQLVEYAENSTVVGVPMSTKLMIGVLTGAGVFGLTIILIILVCVLVQTNKAKKVEKSKVQDSGIPGSHGNQMHPYPGNVQLPTNIPHEGPYPPDGQLREYDNWAYTAAADELGFYPDVISDLSRTNSLGNKDVRWTTISLRAHDNYDYERYGRIPRAKLFERKEELTS